MADYDPTHYWPLRGVYLFLCYTIIFFQLLPLPGETTTGFVPDVMLALTLAWLVRRGLAVPMPLIVAVFLIADLLLQRPPGLFSFIVLIATEMLRARKSEFRAMTFASEWGWIAATVIGITIAHRIMLAVFLMPRPPLSAELLGALATILIYPLVTLISHYIFGIRKIRPGQKEQLGAQT